MKHEPSFVKGLLCLLFSYQCSVNAQSAEKWADMVKWDGVTPWRNYLIYSPGFMGPNALPVPELSNGSIDSINHLALFGSFHFGKGDHTNNIRVTANYCLLKDLLSADISWVTVEWFKTSPQVKEQRHAYYANYDDKKAQGDIYFNINLQLLNQLRKKIHLAFRTGYRYPTSSAVGSARYTDAPGYHFDFSFAKPFRNERFKLTAMFGFYIWQLNTSGQNDAILFGTGVEYNHKTWHWLMNCRGYSGYRNNGDRPVLLSTSIEKRIKNFSVVAHLSRGVHDYQFTSLELGTMYSFNKKS